MYLKPGYSYGLIGRNGCGKSTLMRVIGARCFPIPDGIDIFHLKEEIEATDMTAKEAVMSVDVERSKLEKEAEDLNDIMGEEGAEDTEEIMDRLTQVRIYMSLINIMSVIYNHYNLLLFNLFVIFLL